MGLFVPGRGLNLYNPIIFFLSKYSLLVGSGWKQVVGSPLFVGLERILMTSSIRVEGFRGIGGHLEVVNVVGTTSVKLLGCH